MSSNGTKVTLRPVTSFEVIANGMSLGKFHPKSEWNGLTELRQGNDLLIVAYDKDSLSSIIERCAPGGDQTDKSVTVFSGSPDLIYQIQAAFESKPCNVPTAPTPPTPATTSGASA
jgi:hypothetical protein